LWFYCIGISEDDIVIPIWVNRHLQAMDVGLGAHVQSNDRIGQPAALGVALPEILPAKIKEKSRISKISPTADRCFSVQSPLLSFISSDSVPGDESRNVFLLQ
jgi:hypothetical protein